MGFSLGPSQGGDKEAPGEVDGPGPGARVFDHSANAPGVILSIMRHNDRVEAMTIVYDEPLEGRIWGAYDGRGNRITPKYLN